MDGVPAGVAQKAILDKYNTLSFTPRPAAYLDEAPLVAAAAVNPPYVVITARPGKTEFVSDLDRIETADVTLTIYHTSKADLQDVAAGVQTDGQPINQRSGLDDALALPNLPAGYALNKCERADAGLAVQEQDRGQSAAPVFRGELTYRVELFFDASA